MRNLSNWCPVKRILCNVYIDNYILQPADYSIICASLFTENRARKQNGDNCDEIELRISDSLRAGRYGSMQYSLFWLFVN